MFTLVISCLTTYNLLRFMDLTFQVPMQYCSLHHRTLLLSPVTSTTGYCFCFGSIPSFSLELFLHWSAVAYWAPTNLGSSSFSILSFWLFILFMGFSRQDTEVVCHSLLQWTTFCQNWSTISGPNCGQESLRRNGVALLVNERAWNAVLGYNLKNDNNLSSFPRQTIEYNSYPSLCPNQ